MFFVFYISDTNQIQTARAIETDVDGDLEIPSLDSVKVFVLLDTLITVLYFLVYIRLSPTCNDKVYYALFCAFCRRVSNKIFYNL